MEEQMTFDDLNKVDEGSIPKSNVSEAKAEENPYEKLLTKSEFNKAFIRELSAMGGRHNLISVFGDAVAMMADAMWKATAPEKDKDEVEKHYMSCVERYTKEEMSHLTEMMTIIVTFLGRWRESFLGPILEEIGAAKTRNGQFLTPNDIAKLMAEIVADNEEPGADGLVRISDPACGAGVTLIAQGEELLNGRKIPQRNIFITGGDIDRVSCDISFIELSLLGYAARIDHMNSLTMEILSPSRYTIGYYLHGVCWKTK